MTAQTIVLVPASFIFLASCSGPAGLPLGQHEPVSRTAATAGGPIHFEMSVKEPWRAAVRHEPVQFRVGKDVRIAMEREFIYPSSYEAAVVAGNSGRDHPATPKDFKTVNTGLVAELKTRSVADAVLFEGSVTITEFQGFSRMGGALGQPILDSKGRIITENRIEMPKFATYTTPVSVAVVAGEPARFEISAPRKGTAITLSIE